MSLYNRKLSATVVIWVLLATACSSEQNADNATTDGSESLTSQPTALSQATDEPEIVAQDESSDSTAQDESSDSTGDRSEADVLSSGNSLQPDLDNSEIVAITNPETDTPTTDVTADTTPTTTSLTRIDEFRAPNYYVVELEAPNDIVNKALQFLATELGVAEEEITLTNNEHVVWTDGILGCVEDYIMVEQPLGFRLIFSHNNSSHAVHTDEFGDVLIRLLNCT